MIQDITRRSFIRIVTVATAVEPFAASQLLAQTSNSREDRSAYKRKPECWRACGAQSSFGPPIDSYFQNVTEHWLKVAPLSNPAMLDMFRDRDRLPLRDLVPW